jgi:hypothetical protein
MTVDLGIPILILIILFIRHIGNNVDQVLKIIETQTKSIGLLSNRSSYHAKVINFVVESTKPAIQFVYDYGSEEDKQEIVDILERWKNENPKI